MFLIILNCIAIESATTKNNNDNKLMKSCKIYYKRVIRKLGGGTPERTGKQ